MSCDYCTINNKGEFGDRCGQEEDYEITVNAPDNYTGVVESPYIFHLCKFHNRYSRFVTWDMVIANHTQLMIEESGK